MAILQFTGFEYGAFSASGSGGGFDSASFSGTQDASCTISSSIKKTGGYALRLAPTTTNWQTAVFGGYGADGRPNGATAGFNVATIYSHFDFYYTTKPASSSEEMFRVNDTATGALKFSVRLQSDGKLAIYDSTNTIIGSAGATTLSATTWYQIRVKVGTGLTGAYQVLINGVSEFSGTANLLVTNVGLVALGKGANQNSQSVDYSYDNVVMDDATFPSGTTTVLALKATANGSTMNWGTGTNSSDFNEVITIPEDGTKYVKTTTGAGTPILGLFAMQDCSTVGITGTIQAVKAIIVTRENASNSSAHFPRILSSGSTVDVSPLNGSTIPTPQFVLSLTDPATAVAWTISGVNALEAGAVENNNVSVRCHLVLVEVLWTAPTSTDYPMTASQGSFTLTGQTTAFSYGRKMVASFGSFVLTGQSILYILGHGLVAVYGSFTLTGQTVRLNSVRTMIATFGSYVLTGQTVLLKVGHTLVASYNAFVLTGQSVLFSVGHTLVSAYGSFVLTGQSVTFHTARVMRAVYGTFTLTGQAVRFAVNGLYVKWSNAVKNASTFINNSKNTATFVNRSKNSSSWINRDKTL